MFRSSTLLVSKADSDNIAARPYDSDWVIVTASVDPRVGYFVGIPGEWLDRLGLEV